MAKRGYTRDTIRGGASEGCLAASFELRANVGHATRAPDQVLRALAKDSGHEGACPFLIFSGLPAAILWLLFWGLYPALVAVVLPLPLSFLLAGLYHLGVLDGRHGYVVTWRVLAYPLGFYLPLAAVPMLGPLGAAYLGLVIMPLGLAEVHEVGRLRPCSSARLLESCSGRLSTSRASPDPGPDEDHSSGGSS